MNVAIPRRGLVSLRHVDGRKEVRDGESGEVAIPRRGLVSLRRVAQVEFIQVGPYISCNPPKGIGVAATMSIAAAMSDFLKPELQSPEGDWCRCDTAAGSGRCRRGRRRCNPPKGIGVAATGPNELAASVLAAF